MYHNIAWKYFQTLLISENCVFFWANAPFKFKAYNSKVFIVFPSGTTHILTPLLFSPCCLSLWSSCLKQLVKGQNRVLKSLCLTHMDLHIHLTFNLCLPLLSVTCPSPCLYFLCLSVSQANRNCLVMASTHDIQELDVSSILATQILTWIDDDEAETKG